MGLPVWQPSSSDVPKNATRRDPTASSRSAIRRRRSTEFASTSSSNSLLPPSLGDYFNRRRRTQERREVLSGLIESSRRRASALEQQLAIVDVDETQLTQLRASEARVARHHSEAIAVQEEAYNERLEAGVPRRSPLQRRVDRLPELSRDLPSPSDSTGPGMVEQTIQLSNQIQRLRETLERHQADDARARARAGPWLGPDRQLSSNDHMNNPLSALHENRVQLSSLRSLLNRIEHNFRDLPQNVEDQFRLSVRARYADNPAENPHRDSPRGGWSEDRISEFWSSELTRRLDAADNTPIEAVVRQALSQRRYDNDGDEGQRRDSLSPSSSELSETSGGPVSASQSSRARPRPTGPLSAYPVGTRESRRPREEGPVFASRRVVQSPPSYISAGGIDGLGDRELSVGPIESWDEEAWDTMQTTVAPDRTLPSADSSFTSAAASASFSAASRSHSAQSSAPTSFRGEDECLPGVDMFASG
ncbi:hypothetical protein EG328_003377 [Venturia inaequalis]|uniref:Uncharacterized protein n=1 Tax=Venturia inaequalis TaxID=5025 RepID=A0A8H3VI00_VENIN|nr:hypothetical protein EG328_003377 [Venturia inaequalis]